MRREGGQEGNVAGKREEGGGRSEEHIGRPAASPAGTLEAVRSLLRSRASRAGSCLARQHDEASVTAAIEALLDREVVTPEPTDEECSRFYATHLDRFSSGDLVYARHILFAVTPGAPLQAIRAKAEETLLTLQREPERFEALAREYSNCPSGANGGNLGQLTRGEIVPELVAALFDSRRTGLLPCAGAHTLRVSHRAGRPARTRAGGPVRGGA